MLVDVGGPCPPIYIPSVPPFPAEHPRRGTGTHERPSVGGMCLVDLSGESLESWSHGAMEGAARGPLSLLSAEQHAQDRLSQRVYVACPLARGGRGQRRVRFGEVHEVRRCKELLTRRQSSAWTRRWVDTALGGHGAGWTRRWVNGADTARRKVTQRTTRRYGDAMLMSQAANKA
ncbi:hypothetical protein CC85DRAFT_126153 [Cutaneotrichosporon oleaginosum]|uniref:Uncharacterized protein n=1 Tax=Cutaneotrichosporon oleaginosum TaxID=879819 RepID=A0A0J0XJL0_9TREE|nr:uncharacterized protein CC85DRAFT_126153 [Cutaneotrichosporon oleaginosum]KLT41241.1 hypothetical protein CC85DRAFT_126153 [Cutaneotrichosporon oleaginosum]TXT05504.1 hypothetical protein COLE_06824 [Cutaneotrichosporon oleaginosum]